LRRSDRARTAERDNDYNKYKYKPKCNGQDDDKCNRDEGGGLKRACGEVVESKICSHLDQDKDGGTVMSGAKLTALRTRGGGGGDKMAGSESTAREQLLAPPDMPGLRRSARAIQARMQQGVGDGNAASQDGNTHTGTDDDTQHGDDERSGQDVDKRKDVVKEARRNSKGARKRPIVMY
jgi:hypothetical protein